VLTLVPRESAEELPLLRATLEEKAAPSGETIP
jgi:hypothetical protein